MNVYTKLLDNNIFIPIYKVYLLNDDETISEDITEYVVADTGTISVARCTGQRRSFNFIFQDKDGSLKSLLRRYKIGLKIKVESGYEIDGEEVLFPQGVFVINSLQCSNFFNNASAEIDVVDKYSLLDGTNGGILENTYFAKAGCSLPEFLKSLLVLSIIKDEISPMIGIEFNDTKLPYDINKAVGSTVSEIIEDLAGSFSAWAYYDATGRFCFIKNITDTQKSISHYFNDNSKLLTGEIQKTVSTSNTYNHIIVIGDNIADDISYMGEAFNDNRCDKNSILNSPRKVKLIDQNTDNINSGQLAIERARWELQLAMRKLYPVIIPTIFLPHIREDDVVVITDSKLDMNNEKIVIEKFSFNLGTDIKCSYSGYLVEDF